MNRLRSLLLSVCFAAPLAIAQTPAPAAPTSAAPTTTASTSTAPPEASQFDFLLGQWQLDVHPKVSGLAAMIHGTPKLVGSWKAWRAPDGAGIEDEMRIVDASGNPMSSVTAKRRYDSAQGHWTISGVDLQRKRNSESSGHWQGTEMRVDGKFTDADGNQTLTRTRYYDIHPDSFRMQQDRSSDGGQSWDEAVLTIDAKRVGDAAGAG